MQNATLVSSSIASNASDHHDSLLLQNVMVQKEGTIIPQSTIYRCRNEDTTSSDDHRDDEDEIDDSGCDKRGTVQRPQLIRPERPSSRHFCNQIQSTTTSTEGDKCWPDHYRSNCNISSLSLSHMMQHMIRLFSNRNSYHSIPSAFRSQCHLYHPATRSSIITTSLLRRWRCSVPIRNTGKQNQKRRRLRYRYPSLLYWKQLLLLDRDPVMTTSTFLRLLRYGAIIMLLLMLNVMVPCQMILLPCCDGFIIQFGPPSRLTFHQQSQMVPRIAEARFLPSTHWNKYAFVSFVQKWHATSSMTDNHLSPLDASTSTTTTKPLHQYTIKELRDMIVLYTTNNSNGGSSNYTVATNSTDQLNVHNNGIIDSKVSLTSSSSVAWSKLKRKQDYIDFIIQMQTGQQQEMTAVIEATRKQDGVVPSIVSNTNNDDKNNNAKNSNGDNNDNSSGRKQKLQSMPPLTNHQYQSPKDIIVEEVYRRYPPLRPSPQQKNMVSSSSVWANPSQPSLNTYTSNNNQLDVRQLYHPVMRHLVLTHGSNSTTSITENVIDENDDSPGGSVSNNIVQSDMDIVCIGTASCTPGITRGVSCTAIRCNWNRRSTSSTGISTSMSGTTTNVEYLTNQNKAAATTETTFTASQSGTWIFDVGECTQVSTGNL